jgi:integrase
MSLYQRGETWHIDIQHEGRRLRESTGFTDKKAAQRYHDEKRAELWATPSAGVERTWLDACTDWLTAAERSESDRYNLRAFNEVFSDRPLSACTPDDIAKALADKSAATYNRHRAMIVAILNMAGVALKLPQRKTKVGRLRFLTHEEWQRLHAALPPHLQPIAAFAIATGLRQHNVTHLRWQEVDLARAVLWVHPDEAKAEKPIGIPLSKDATKILRDQLEKQKDDKHKEWVFPYKGRGRKEGGPVTKIKTAWQIAMEKAGLGHFERWEDAEGKAHKRWHGDFTFHGLRHTWASWHVMSGTPLEVLQKLGGWSDLRMVMKYAHLAPGYLAGFADNARPWQPDNKKAA